MARRPSRTSPPGRTIPAVTPVEPALRAAPIVLVAVIAFAVYANTLSNGFVNDDEHQVLRNPWITDVRFIPDIFSKSVWSFLPGAKIADYYRPLMHVVYLINYHLFGFQAWGFHLVNVLFHVGNTVVVVLLTARLTGFVDTHGSRGRDWVSAFVLSSPFVAGLLFATHPVHTEAVAWIASIPELSFTLFYLLSFYLYVAPGGGRRSWMPSVALFCLALLCKETAITLPALLVAYDTAFRRSERSTADRLLRYAPYLLVAAAYLVLRQHVLSQSPVRTDPLSDLSSYQVIINVGRLFGAYAGKLLLPVNLNFWHSFRPIMSVVTPEGFLSLAVGGGFLAALWVSWRKDRLSFLCLSLSLIPLAPAFYISTLPGKSFAERYFYLPSVGFVILAAVFLQRVASLRRARRAAVFGLVVTATLYAIGTMRRNLVWRDAYTLYSDTVSKSPDAPAPPFDLAVALFNQGSLNEAMAHFRILVEADPDDARYQSAFGSALLLKGQLDEAIKHLQTALLLDPRSLESHNDLAIALRRKGDVQAAIAQYRKALAVDPEYADAHFNLGGALADTGQTTDAMEHYRAAVRLRPDNAYYRNVLGIEYGKQGDREKAIEQFQEAVRLMPSEPAYSRNLDRARALTQVPEASPEKPR